MAPRIIPLKQRFESKFIPEPNSGCWLWLAAITNGYGRFMVGSRTNHARRAQPAHRVAWEIYRGPIPNDLCVLHKCDVRCCVNPSHLFLGTLADNVADMDIKGRRRMPKGEDNWRSILNAENVDFIRQSTLGPRALAKIFGVHRETIRQVKTRSTWKHLS